MSETQHPLAKMSEKMTEETDVFVEGVDIVVTKGSVVDGNEVTLRVFGEENDVLLGFDAEQYEAFVEKLAPNAESDWEVVD